ncbi:MAG TPA: Zn-dependent hydrolase [Steroidobacteraceae bacterium]|nr:Zn-dependent hydrolase [Steroidobacteraceae bacterium]
MSSHSISRRDLLATLLCACASGSFARAAATTPSKDKLTVDAARLQRTLEELSTFGRPAGASFAEGVSRVAYSDADIAGRAYVIAQMKAAGLDLRVDPAGNIIGRRAGSGHALKPILFGSHIDSVPSGGNFDGDLGSLSALEVIRRLNEERITTRHPLEVTIWSNEEGGTIGSLAVIGGLSPTILNWESNSVRIADGLRRIGGDPDRLEEARRAPGSIHCYLELHIEQGGLLDKAGVPIGVVDGIVSIDEYEVEVRGFANHAGTTPMPERRNALLAAAKIIEAVQEEVTRMPGRQVGTVGHLEVYPNTRNVIPGLVKHSIELRDLSEEKLATLGAAIQQRIPPIARETQTEISVRHVTHDPAALATPAIQREIEAAASTLGLRTLHLPSGAGHDAQVLAKVGPMGMIFVPSVAGISHSPHELSRWADCANGANVLLQTVMRMDRS